MPAEPQTTCRERALSLRDGEGNEFHSLCQQAARWIQASDLVEWLVPQPLLRAPATCTFRDAEHDLPLLDLSVIQVGASASLSALTCIRVGPSAWIGRNRDVPFSTIDFTHEECLEAFAGGGQPSFLEDVSDDVFFILSVVGLPSWRDLPCLPVRAKAFRSRSAQASLAGDLLRFALRLWLSDVPTAFLCPSGLDFVPSPLQALSGLAMTRLGDLELWHSSACDWEPLCFTFSN